MTEKEMLEYSKEMIQHVEDNEIYYIGDLWYYAENNRPDDWLVVLRNRKTYFGIKTYVQSRRDSAQRSKKHVPLPSEDYWTR